MNRAVGTVTAFLAAFTLSTAACAVLPSDETATSFPGGAASAAASQPTASLEDQVDGYLAVAPRILRPGESETVSVSLFHGERSANATVRLALVRNSEEVASTSDYVRGHGNLSLSVPALGEGEYRLRLSGNGFLTESPVQVEDGTLVFAETDKPIYKPGQTIHIRTYTLDPSLRPVTASVDVEVTDAKGLKVFKRGVATDQYGMASLDLPLSAEPNLGVWKIAARTGKRTVQLDVRVERYVLPKYEVKLDLPREWVLASDPIVGSVSAEYSFGKPVQGEVEIHAYRYVGSWQEFARDTRSINGKADFQLPPVSYVSGVPAAGGMGNVRLEAVVRERATGYEEKSTRLLTVAAAPVVLRVIPESVAFKPSLPLTLLVVAESPDKRPVDADVRLEFSYTRKDFTSSQETRQLSVRQGRATIRVTPPSDALSLTMSARSGSSFTSLAMESSYSPTGSFIHLEQVGQGALKVGETASFRVTSTREAGTFYYEVVARGKVVFSDLSRSPDIQFTLTPLMAPSARLLAYQLLPNSEVAADYLPFTVEGDYPQKVQAAFDKQEVKPGEQVEVQLKTEGPAEVGLAAVDRSLFMLAESRVNLQQLFDALEKLYQMPQAELHDARPLGKIVLRGAKQVFDDAGVVVLSNKQVPEGKEYQLPVRRFAVPGLAGAAAEPLQGQAVPALVPKPEANPAAKVEGLAGGLMEVQRIRQFFPETWIWDTVTTDQAGLATKRFEVPDSITTWMLRAVGLSRQAGLGVSETQLRVVQPFFVTVDLPYSAIRGEQLPVRVALYNYQQDAQRFQVELEPADWFRLANDQAVKTVSVGANDLGAVSFSIQPIKLGTNKLRITARSASSADAVEKELIVEPEGVAREMVENLVLSAGASRQLDISFPEGAVEGSTRAYLAVTGSYLTQTIDGLEKLLQMPFGCGEQNMILFAPNVYVTRYLKESGQLKPEVMARAEQLMITGYQRELTYRRNDGSFSAFGNQDKDGSLWLTAFVMKTFAQARDVIYVDDAVLSSARDWIVKQQKPDGSFEPVGFVHHQELLGGLRGKAPLTAYLAVALKEVGEQTASARAVSYLEGALGSINDAYGVALAAYALELAKSPKAQAAYDKLLAMAHQTDEGLYWGDEGAQPLQDSTGRQNPVVGREPIVPVPNRSADIETTGYATLAMIEHGDRLSASRAARWLVSRRNAYGGFGSTQDTVVGLQALTRYAASAKADVDATVTLRSGAWQKEVVVTPASADVLQIVELPAGSPVTVQVRGVGQVVVQSVRRFNLPRAQEQAESAFQIQVDYSVGHIQVNDLIDVIATMKFTPPQPVEAGMVVVDVAIPTGFAPVSESLEALVRSQAKVKRYDVAGRKVILYIEDMAPGEQLRLAFKARALYPVKAEAVASQVYAYYRPEWKGESLGGATEVR